MPSPATHADLPTVPTKRALLLRDGFTFLTLLCVTMVLFGLTWTLFRSFESHREELAVRWSERGREALAQGKPAEAIVALRTALSYAPGDYGNELLLAEALGAAGHTDEATAYFLGLWESRPGDGYLNLQLARLARRAKNPTAAIDYYRAAIFGSWPGQAVQRRREIRLELAGFLVERHDPAAARAELLIAASNADDDPALAVTLGDALLRASDPADAMTYYRKAIARQPHNRAALERAGRLAFDSGDFPTAHDLLARAEREPALPVEGQPPVAKLIADSSRLLQLDLSRSLPARERVEHLLEASEIARRRLDACSSQLGAPAPLLALSARWTPLTPAAERRSLAHDEDMPDAVAQLIGDTERATAQLCGAPTGDDALLLRLAGPE
ncbi:Tfp pilus assembly protein PilF [Granulicella rosea]|uniref:Tfp pilus assembly protein PilF n=1 Tax=Granulicella rosea TaxID=474952 RepID=A0A239K998_9BACT|nr:tetratricopeptide repeat protein [Granulicella rosea]SNT14685.1 Tfp pilus assembly protein PilF [Granulicella rosea]